jgi:hypothetical protein
VTATLELRWCEAGAACVEAPPDVPCIVVGVSVEARGPVVPVDPAEAAAGTAGGAVVGGAADRMAAVVVGDGAGGGALGLV